MPKTYLGSNALDDPDLAASQVTSGTFDDARIPAGITRDSELDAEVTDLATAIADGDASTLTSAQSYADGKVSDTAYNESSWNAVTGIAPSKNAVRDQIEALASIYQPLHADLTDLAARWVAASASGPASLDFLEDTDNGSNYARVTAPAALGGDRTLTLPDETGTLVSTGSLGVYSAYTPTVAQNGTRTTSAMLARYCQVGKIIHAYGQCTVSNTGTAGNPITLSIPVSARGTEGSFGHGYIYDSSAGLVYLAIILLEAGTFNFRPTNDTAGGKIGNTTPSFAIANGDIIAWNVTYEAA